MKVEEVHSSNTQIEDKDTNRGSVNVWRLWKNVVLGPYDVLAKPLVKKAKVLDAGCGKGGRILAFKDLASEIVGFDIETNEDVGQAHDQFFHGDLAATGLSDEEFDLINCEWVIEHLYEPQKVFSEFYRILKNGGRLLLVTPNRHSLFYLFARSTPQWFHNWWRRRAFKVSEDDTFKTVYKCNTKQEIDRTLTGLGFTREALDFVPGIFIYLASWEMAARLCLRIEQSLVRLIRPTTIIAVYKKD